jgi:hypothetical protein
MLKPTSASAASSEIGSPTTASNDQMFDIKRRCENREGAIAGESVVFIAA